LKGSCLQSSHPFTRVMILNDIDQYPLVGILRLIKPLSIRHWRSGVECIKKYSSVCEYLFEMLDMIPPPEGCTAKETEAKVYSWAGTLDDRRIDSLARHLRTQHLQRKRAPFSCPNDGCSAVLKHAKHFATHVTGRLIPTKGSPCKVGHIVSTEGSVRQSEHFYCMRPSNNSLFTTLRLTPRIASVSFFFAQTSSSYRSQNYTIANLLDHPN